LVKDGNLNGYGEPGGKKGRRRPMALGKEGVSSWGSGGHITRFTGHSVEQDLSHIMHGKGIQEIDDQDRNRIGTKLGNQKNQILGSREKRSVKNLPIKLRKKGCCAPVVKNRTPKGRGQNGYYRESGMRETTPKCTFETN